MSFLMPVIVWILAILLLVIMLVLATPWRLRLNWNSNQAPAVSVEAQLLGGLLPAVRFSDIRTRQRRKSARPKKTKSIAPKRFVQTRTIVAGLNLFLNLLKRLRLKRAIIVAKFGFDDPAETGQVYGALLPIMLSVNRPADFKLVAQPHFDHRCFDGEADVHVQLTPISLAIPILGFIWQAFGPKR